MRLRTSNQSALFQCSVVKLSQHLLMLLAPDFFKKRSKVCFLSSLNGVRFLCQLHLCSQELASNLALSLQGSPFDDNVKVISFFGQSYTQVGTTQFGLLQHYIEDWNLKIFSRRKSMPMGFELGPLNLMLTVRLYST